MLHIPKIDDYLKVLTDEEVKDFVAINFSESVREEQNLRKVPKALYISLTAYEKLQSNSTDNGTHDYSVKVLNLFDPELELINTKPVIINKLKEFLSDLK